jgi:hypothetical protein
MKERNPLSQAEKGFKRRTLNKGGYARASPFQIFSCNVAPAVSADR